MKCASETCAIRARLGMSSGWAYARSMASRARNIARFVSSTALLTATSPLTVPRPVVAVPTGSVPNPTDRVTAA
ncbi:hypothetical protein Vlu01_06540 [Micromonospora lutea]|uniref:Uncharacterized protein n=1 Tax=Micromonospora lutea TaxID=419825 RepID=A0ABQ4IQD1_9ACTN|nr:hypothetical protein Vlu01_06540 [Micromonospora lutea]